MKTVDLVAEVGRVVTQARELAEERGPYPNSDMGYRITSEGVVFFDEEPNSYEEGTHPVELPPITWADIENPGPAIARFQADRGKRAREMAEANAKWEREMYERLKPKFEK